MSEDKKFYQSYVTTHINSRKSLPKAQDLSKNSGAFKQHFGHLIPKNKNAKILDLGCGYGIFVWWLHQNGYSNSHGIDISKEQIDLGNKLGITNIKEGDGLEYLNNSSGEYDAIILRDVIEHIEKINLLSLLTLCFANLKSGGRLIIQTVNGTSPFHGDILYGDFTHKWAYTGSSISQLMSEVGFKSTKIYPWKPPRRGRTLIRYLLWLLVELILRIISFSHGGKFSKIMTINLVSISIK